MAMGHWGTTALPGRVRFHHKKFVVNWETLPPHPVVMADTQGTHTHIKAMGVTGNTLLIGYGDWTINLGPVKVVGYDLHTGQPVTLMEQPPELGSEAWDRINIIDGKAYLPHVDPTLNNQGAYTTNERGVWETVKVGTNPSMIHTFDVIKFKGKMISCGSMGASGSGAACVYTETEEGSRVFTRTLLGNSRADFARFYKFYLFNNGNEVRVQNFHGGLETFSSTDGTNWGELPNEPVYPGNDSENRWDANDPLVLPAGYAQNSGLSPVLSTLQYNNWVYVAGKNGVVKRALLPDVVETPAPGATPSINLSKNPVFQNLPAPYNGNNAVSFVSSPSREGGKTVRVTNPAGGFNRLGVVEVFSPPLTPGSYCIRSWYYWPSTNVATAERFRVQAVGTTYLPLGPPDQWNMVETTVSAGETVGAISVWLGIETTPLDPSDQMFWWGFQISPYEASVPMPYFFTGDTPPVLAYRHEWAGTPHNSASLRKVRGAVPNGFASLFTETF